MTAVDPVPPAKRGRPTGDDTVTRRRRAQTTEIPIPLQEFECHCALNAWAAKQ